MNCKPGDLAIVVAPDQISIKLLGRVVRVARLSNNPAWVSERCWEIEGGRIDMGAFYQGAIPDAWLLPIRDADAEDEMLRIAGKPTETPADIIKEVA